MEEPWLRGSVSGVSTMVAPLLMSFQMAREDLDRHTAGLEPEHLWRTPLGLPSVGFQLRHIAGSVDRLSTYLSGELLSDSQMEALRAEAKPGASREELLQAIDHAFAQCEALIKTFPPEELEQPRTVGRKRLPTTVIGLIVHIAEHTQRHVGQAITTAKVVRATAGGSPAPAAED